MGTVKGQYMGTVIAVAEQHWLFLIISESTKILNKGKHQENLQLACTISFLKSTPCITYEDELKMLD